MQIAFLSNFVAICSFNLPQNEILACFCVNLLNLGLFFRICLPVVVFD